MATPRKVIYLSPEDIEVREVTEEYKPTASQSLVQVKYSGINPADLKHNTLGLHSYVAGYDFMGEVLETGPDSKFRPGDNICGLNIPVLGRPMYQGAHQDLAIADSPYWVHVPKDTRPEEAAVIPAIVLTAGDGLFDVLGYGFPAADLDGKDPTGVPILIWGGGSSVGIATIQLAKAVGFSPIFVTASPQNHEALLDLGATKVFDYHSPRVVEEIQEAAAASGKKLTTAYDAVCVGVFGPEEEAKVTSSTALVYKTLSNQGPDINVTGVLPVSWIPDWVMVCGCRTDEDSLFGMPQKPEWQDRSVKILECVASNYSSIMRVPNVKVVKGIENAMSEIRRISAGNGSFEKVAVKHPF